eukprot:CAMPEP_0168564186 /NCGR_PEP_ID=MMETSP0413-20121227/13099_1 /TAXON_ID=136452 /ORGANISM="Filamoeba nolandi, Strain NC-AS-23-1" /LENGTH=458 /DNA_ID=CAMNT_0008595817 /DNA_START=6 /DNA_END=1379 /DNA_ORIENTATION=+
MNSSYGDYYAQDNTDAQKVFTERKFSSYPRQDLWYINGKAYDLDNFAKTRHPGGSAIYRGRGIECTSMFHSYHPLKLPDLAVIEQYRVPEEDLGPEFFAKLKDNNTPQFTFKENGFYQTVRKRVVRYFAETKQERCAPFWYQLVLLGMVLVSSLLMYLAHVKGSLLCAALYGIARGVVSLDIGHAILHYSIFRSPKTDIRWTKLVQFFTVSTEDIWAVTHNIAHHTFLFTPADVQTNYSWKRTQPWLKQQLPNLQKYQHYYIWILYFFGCFLWGVQDLIESLNELFITGKNRIGLPSSLLTRIMNVIVCTVTLFTSTVLPFLYHDFLWAMALAVISTLLTSAVVVFQIVVNHEEDIAVEPLRKSQYPEKIDWGVHQLNTSVNFASSNMFWIQLGGGLNMQVEHHLFPSIHYLHYPEIRKIVMEVAKEQGVPYLEFDSIWQAIASHYRAVKMGAASDKD